jgi:hypothetical protein
MVRHITPAYSDDLSYPFQANTQFTKTHLYPSVRLVTSWHHPGPGPGIGSSYLDLSRHL